MSSGHVPFMQTVMSWTTLDISTYAFYVMDNYSAVCPVRQSSTCRRPKVSCSLHVITLVIRIMDTLYFCIKMAAIYCVQIKPLIMTMGFSYCTVRNIFIRLNIVHFILQQDIL